MPGRSLRAVAWMGWLFVVGSACFAAGVPVSQVQSLAPTVAAAIFFIGSIFFTSASTVQMRLAWVAMRPRALLTLRNPDWSSAVVQWVGTLFFNATTLASLIQVSGKASVSNQVVWRPDAFGSILFLVSSAIALAPEARKARNEHVRGRSWAIAALNMLGSIFFGISAVGAWVVPETDEVLNSAWANGGTFLGAVFFLVGGWLVIPSRRHKAATTG
ncbi:MAG: hypothetical protein ACXVQ4_10455 [Gaiellaceae bacterium]